VNPQDLLKTFTVECRELLEVMESTLLAVNESAPDSEALNEIFRVAHTIKGSAGLVGLEHIVHFAHAMESVLDAAREGRLSLDAELVTLLLACCDHHRVLIAAVEAGCLDADPATTRLAAPLLERLDRYRAAKSRQSGLANERSGRSQHARADGRQWHISLRFGSAALRNGMDPVSFIHYLEQLGEIVGLVTLFDAIPVAQEMDPEACYLGFEIAFETDANERTLAGVFELAGDDCEVHLLPPRSPVSEYVRLIRGSPESAERLGELLVGCGSLTQDDLDAALASLGEAHASPPPLVELSVQPGRLQPEVVHSAVVKPRHAKAPESRSLRVDADKLDQLIDLVGELIIATASVNLIARSARLPEVQQSTATLTSLVEAVRDGALQLRMVKIGATFNRFQRVVHDVSRELGKDIVLSVSGEDAELDKTVVEKIGDPLLHLVRNAIDHGIEAPEARAARGKSTTGTVSLNAYHESGNIVIEVSDDGGGLKRDKILAKALERGLVEVGRSLSDSEIYNLIFEPGFSTAEQVTNLSGRGVGMDVVKRNITALRGSVSVDSQEGVGTTVTVRLPLTLAIINGFLVGLGKSVFVVPLDMIEECMELTVDSDRDYTDLRGSVLPFIRLRRLFSLEAPRVQRQNVVVVRSGEHRAGLVVDTLLGEFQTVIKPLGQMFNRVKCISGSSILGNGEVALILDVPTLIEQAAQVASENRNEN
jgi:two-component system, chemotaxis family, sensor kinase CheA